MTLLIVAVVAAATSAGAWLASREAFRSPVLQRRNYRGVDVPVGAGVLLVFGALGASASLAVADAVGRDPLPGEQLGVVLALVVAGGFGMLGIFDDIAATGDARGFKGHVGSLARGQMTTGALKLLGGGLLSLAVVGALAPDGLLALAVGGTLVALAANVGNLFDRAPGRTTKVALLAAVLLLAVSSAADRDLLVGVVAVVAAGAGLLRFDLREELMLGDAGSNVLGAALGLGVVATTSLPVQAAVLVVLAGLNVASEALSFSRVIDATAPLRWLDRLGRRAPDT